MMLELYRAYADVLRKQGLHDEAAQYDAQIVKIDAKLFD